MGANDETSRVVEVTEADLPLHCPTPKSSMWNMHPRVFLDVVKTGQMLCPYCGTRYIYKGQKPKGH
jgi:uncharacterized Zn-finger protein